MRLKIEWTIMITKTGMGERVCFRPWLPCCPLRRCEALDTLTQILYFIFVKKCCCIEKKNNNCIVTMAIHHSIQKTPLHVGCGLTKTRTFCCTMYITLLLVVRYKITIEKYMHFVSYSLFDSIHSFKSCCCTAVWMEFLF